MKSTTTKVNDQNKRDRLAVGTRVRILHTPRVSQRHLIGQIGCVTGSSNAGFRGIEHTVVVRDCGRSSWAYDVAAADLEVIR